MAVNLAPPVTVPPYICLSSDTKPTGALPGSLAYETDTGAWFIYNGSAWVAYHSASFGGKVFINDTSNAFMTTGLTINQGAADDEILTLKSSDVAHALVSQTETDTFLAIKKSSNDVGASGGAAITAFGENSVGLVNPMAIQVFGGQASTSKLISSRGLISLFTFQHDGAGNLADVTANGNVVSIVARRGGGSEAILHIDREGTIHTVPAGGADADIDLLTVEVTGAPTISWDESEDAFGQSKGWRPTSDNAMALGSAALRYSDVRSVLINGADYGMANGWRMVESEVFGYSKGWSVGFDQRWPEGVSLWENREAAAGTRPVFAVTEEFIEFSGRRLTPAMIDQLIALTDTKKDS